MNLLAAAPYVEQAQVTNWPARIAWVLIVLVVIGLALWGMRSGWRGRAGRQSVLPAPELPPTSLSEAALLRPVVTGRYLATASAGDWLDRVVVHDLGVPSGADLSIYDSGLLIDRDGSAPIWIPRESIADVRLDRGLAGRVHERGGIVVITWRLGESLVDSGFRASATDDHVGLLDTLLQLTPETTP